MKSSLKLMVSLMIILVCGKQLIKSNERVSEKLYNLVQQYHKYKTDGYYQRRQYWATSNLGSFMFKRNVRSHYRSRSKLFVILYWRFWDPTRMGDFGDRKIFDTCSVKNCKVTTNIKDMKRADAVVVRVQHGLLPESGDRRMYQRWIFLSDESPANLFTFAYPKPTLEEWADLFNWTMTYRTDSDIPIPYGRTIPLFNISRPREMPDSITELIPNWKLKQRKVYLTILVSHCNVPERTNYIEELKKYIKVDMYGLCSPNVTVRYSCPGSYGQDCPLINKYLFYLAFENSLCRQYITEKTFYNSYLKGNIPIIMGAPKDDCDKLLPPHSFLHIDSFASPKDLAENVMSISRNEKKLLMFHQWRRYFEIVNEHGFFRSKSSHICRVCEALNYNDNRHKVYSEDDLKLFFDTKLVCKREYPFSKYEVWTG